MGAKRSEGRENYSWNAVEDIRIYFNKNANTENIFVNRNISNIGRRNTLKSFVGECL